MEILCVPHSLEDDGNQKGLDTVVAGLTSEGMVYKVLPASMSPIT